MDLVHIFTYICYVQILKSPLRFIPVKPKHMKT